MVQIGKILFEKSSALWEDDESYRAFIKCKEMYLNDLLKFRGYLYRNQIYEELCVGWDANDINTCIKYVEGEYIILHMGPKRNNEFLVTILISNKKEEL